MGRGSLKTSTDVTSLTSLPVPTTDLVSSSLGLTFTPVPVSATIPSTSTSPTLAISSALSSMSLLVILSICLWTFFTLLVFIVSKDTTLSLNSGFPSISEILSRMDSNNATPFSTESSLAFSVYFLISLMITTLLLNPSFPLNLAFRIPNILAISATPTSFKQLICSSIHKLNVSNSTPRSLSSLSLPCPPSSTFTSSSATGA